MKSNYLVRRKKKNVNELCTQRQRIAWQSPLQIWGHPQVGGAKT